MKNQIIAALFLITLVLSSCQNKSNERNIKVLDTNVPKEELHGSIQFPVVAGIAGDLYELDSLLLVWTPSNPVYSSEGFFSIVSKTTGDVKYVFDEKGRGPEEYIMPKVKLTEKNVVSLWDGNSNTYAEIAIVQDSAGDIAYDFLRDITIKKGGHSIHKYNEDTLISSVNTKGLFALFNDNGKQMGRYFGRNPLGESIGNYRISFQGIGAISKSPNLFVFGTLDLGYLCAYEIDKKKPALKWECYIDKPYYSIENGRIKWDEDKHVKGIRDIQIINSYILVLYNGKSVTSPVDKPEGVLSDSVFVFDLKGNLVKKFHLDVPVLQIMYSQNDQAMYGTTMKNEDWHIVKFKVSSLL
jgi:hypothetical protein